MTPIRFALLLSALVTAAAPQPSTGVFEYLVAPSRPGNQRNSEADILELRDGRLLLAWTEFYSNEGSDWGPSRISARISSDRGRTWGDKFTLQENIGKMNVMEADLLRLRSGKILFVFALKNSEADCRPMVRLSSDDGKTFSPPRPMAIEPDPSYTGFNHDRAIQLRSGRILVPVFFTTDWRVKPRVESRVYYSDDEGTSWKWGPAVDVPASRAGADEPGVLELKDGRVMLILRTSAGHPYCAWSSDHGQTWSTPVPLPVDAPGSPQSLKRIPSTGDLLLIWNNSTKNRFPLTSAVSKDEGRTWMHVRNLDEDPAHTYAYTSIIFVGERVLFTYYAGPPAGAGKSSPEWSLKLKSVPVRWLYENH